MGLFTNRAKASWLPVARLPSLAWLIAVLILVGWQSRCALAGVPLDPGDSPAHAAPELPADVNQANLRVAALDALYELDLSVDQLHDLQKLARDAASGRSRTTLNNPRFALLLKRFQEALLDGNNDQTIARLRGEVVDQIESVEGLDDQIQPTGPALKSAPDFCRSLRASQVAAFLASHADEINDPSERMVEAVEELRSASGNDALAVGRKIADEVGQMVGGLDQEKSKAVSAQVMDWLKQQPGSRDQLTDAERTKLQQSAAKAIGDVSNMEVLDHWLQMQMAVLLSNPQLPQAINAMGDAKLRAQKNADAENKKEEK
jgi:hypothetical protein